MAAQRAAAKTPDDPPSSPGSAVGGIRRGWPEHLMNDLCRSCTSRARRSHRTKQPRGTEKPTRSFGILVLTHPRLLSPKPFPCLRQSNRRENSETLSLNVVHGFLAHANKDISWLQPLGDVMFYCEDDHFDRVECVGKVRRGCQCRNSAIADLVERVPSRDRKKCGPFGDRRLPSIIIVHPKQVVRCPFIR